MKVPVRSLEESSRTTGSSRVGLGLLAILLGTWLVYAGTLQAPWVFDDHKYLVDPVLHPTELSVGALLDATTGTEREAARWLPNLSFATQFYLWGSESTLPFHAFNTMVHCLVVVLVFLFLRSTLLLADLDRVRAERVAQQAAHVLEVDIRRVRRTRGAPSVAQRGDAPAAASHDGDGLGGRPED